MSVRLNDYYLIVNTRDRECRKNVVKTYLRLQKLKFMHKIYV